MENLALIGGEMPFFLIQGGKGVEMEYRVMEGGCGEFGGSGEGEGSGDFVEDFYEAVFVSEDKELSVIKLNC